MEIVPQAKIGTTEAKRHNFFNTAKRKYLAQAHGLLSALMPNGALETAAAAANGGNRSATGTAAIPFIPNCGLRNDPPTGGTSKHPVQVKAYGIFLCGREP
jgi:hypothetical protein